MKTRLVWNSIRAEQWEWVLPAPAVIIPPVGVQVTARVPLAGQLQTIVGRASEVAVDYSRDEVVVFLEAVEISG